MNANPELLHTQLAYWSARSSSEKRMLICGFVFILFIIIYLTFLAPLNRSITDLKQSLAEQNNLLIWLQQQAPILQQLREQNNNAPVHVIRKNKEESLITFIEESIRVNKLSKYQVAIQQQQNNIIRIEFKKISFDDLMQWLNRINTAGIAKVKQASISRQDKPGMVRVNLQLESNGFTEIVR